MLSIFDIRIAFLYAILAILVPGVLPWEATTKRETCLKFCAETETGRDKGEFSERYCGIHQGTLKCGEWCQPACGEGDCNPAGYVVCPAPPSTSTSPPPTTSPPLTKEEAERKKKEKEKNDRTMIWVLVGSIGPLLLGLVIALRRKIRLCCMACRPRGRPITPAAGPPPEMGVPLNMAQSSDTVPPSVEQVGQPSGNEAAQPTEVPTSV